MTIKIPVSAEFQADDVQKQIAQINAQFKSMGDAIAKANNQRFEPITLKTKEDLKYYVQQSEKLLKIQGELRNRMERSGQGGKNPLMANWGHLYMNENTRMKRQQEMLVYFGGEFEDGNKPAAPKKPAPHAPIPPVNQPGGSGGGRRPPGGNPWVQQGTRVLQSGLNAAGPVGGVAAGALNTGMSAGFGAGLMGLVGGMVALGVGKIVGAATEKIDQAERNNVEFDRLKRTLGDVNVSFAGLKTLIHDNANNLAITFEEAGKLSMSFAKLGNVSDDQYHNLGKDIGVGVGFSRGFGLDPEQGNEMFGRMRGLRLTSNDQDSKRMALLIGETIGKSNAFAKADEVMEAIASFATMQTRQVLATPNLRGYAGEYSALVGSGIPGLDPAGAGGLLSRVNSSLMAGGARGEASQFFTSMVSERMGLNPIQSAIMREGGAFATNDLMFGGGSAASRFGIKGPQGDSTFLQNTLQMLREKYPEKGMQAMAAANHLGIGMNQAMALLSVNPNEMGGLQRGLSDAGIDMGTLNSAGIANLSKVFTGSDGDRQAVANSLYGRTGNQALTTTESDRLRTAMAGDDVEAQKKILAELVSSRDQEKTQGSDIRDSKNLLDNIKTAVADKLIPLVTEMRHGVMAIAGVGKDGMTPQKIQEQVVRAEYQGKADAITQQYQAQIDEQLEKSNNARGRTVGMLTDDEAELPRDQQMKAMVERQERAKAEMEEADAEIERLKAERDGKLKGVQTQADAAVDGIYGVKNGQPPSGWKPGVSPIGGITDVQDPVKRQRLAAFLEAIAASEGANYDTIVGGTKTISDYSKHPNVVGLTTKDGKSTAAGRYQITKSTWDSLSYLGLSDFGPESQDIAAIELLRRRGALDDVLGGDVDGALGKLGSEWQGLPSGTSRNQGKRSRAYFDAQYNAGLERNKPAELPESDSSSGQSSVNVNVPPIEVRHLNEQGQTVQPTQTIQPVVTPARPFGMGG